VEAVALSPARTARDTAQAMSEENVQIVRRIFVNYKSGDIAASVKNFDPEVEFDMTFRPDGRTFHGHAGIAEGMRTWTGTFEGWSFEIEEMIDAGDQVITTTRESGRGKGSGIDIDQIMFHVAHLRDGKVIRWKLFRDRGQAFEAAGLSE
jgi:ketosteroid isomerase-like protein